MHLEPCPPCGVRGTAGIGEQITDPHAVRLADGTWQLGSKGGQ